MKSTLTCLLITLLAVVVVSSPLAEPIIKPMKYHGPIPRTSFSLRLGFLGNATNQEMWDKLDALAIERSGQAFTDDFSNSLIVEGTITQKLHPKFAVRANGSAAFLRSDSHGRFVPSISGEIDPPIREFQREFNVDLFTIGGDAIYYFTDASVQEFQPYVGAGFSMWIPHAVYTDNFTDAYNIGAMEDSVVVRPEFKKTEWSFEAGIQAVVGAHYYLNPNYAVTAETRYHIAQSRFTQTIPTSVGNRDANFIVDYTGFVFSIGLLRAF